MTIIASLLFLAVVSLALFTIIASINSSLTRIFDIIDNRNIDLYATPTIRIGEVKHHRVNHTNSNTVSSKENIIAFPLNLTDSLNNDDTQWDRAA